MKLLILFGFFAVLSLPLLSTAQSNPPSRDNRHDEYVQEFREEVRANRPSISYAVFEPAIKFFEKAYQLFGDMILFLVNSIGSVFGGITTKLRSL